MTSNITKSFNQRKKFGLRMATGGIVEQMNSVANLSNTDRYKLGMSGTAAEASTLQERAGILSGLQTSAAPAPAVATQPVAKPYDHMATVQSRGETISALGSKLRSMQQAAPKVASSPLDAGSSMAPMPKVGLRAGGLVTPVEGEGTGTSDDVPVVLAGHEVNVSNGEGVAVLPAKTMRDKAAVRSIENIIENSNGKPVNKGLRDGGAYEEGVVQKKEWRGLLEPKPTADFDPQTHKGVTPIVPNVPYDGQDVRISRPDYKDPTLKVGKAITDAEAGAAIRATRDQIMRGGHGAQSTTPIGLDKSKMDPENAVPGAYAKAASAENNMRWANTRGAALNNATGIDPSAPILKSYKPASLQEEMSDQEKAATQVAWAAQDAMAQGVDPNLTSMERANVGLRQAVNDPDAKVINAMNSANTLRGNGIVASTRVGADGEKQLMLSGGAPTKPQYVGADGKATNNWYETQAYKDAIGRNQRMSDLASQMERDRAVRDMDASQVKDPRVIASAGLRMAALNEEGKNAVALAKNQLENKRWGIERSDRLGKEEREYGTARSDKFEKERSDWLDQVSMETDDKGVARVNPVKRQIYDSIARRNLGNSVSPEQFRAAQPELMDMANMIMKINERIENRPMALKFMDWLGGVKPETSENARSANLRAARGGLRDMAAVGLWDAPMGKQVLDIGGTTIELSDLVEGNGTLNRQKLDQVLRMINGK